MASCDIGLQVRDAGHREPIVLQLARILRNTAILTLVAATGAHGALAQPAGSQEPDFDLQFARQVLDPNFAEAASPADGDDFGAAPWDGGSGQLLALTLLHTYRNTLARTDLDLCAFRPSCSRFAQLAIDEFGLLHGILLGTDRLLRDGPSALDYGYAPANDGRHLLDPIGDYLDEPCSACGHLVGRAHE